MRQKKRKRKHHQRDINIEHMHTPLLFMGLVSRRVHIMLCKVEKTYLGYLH